LYQRPRVRWSRWSDYCLKWVVVRMAGPPHTPGESPHTPRGVKLGGVERFSGVGGPGQLRCVSFPAESLAVNEIFPGVWRAPIGGHFAILSSGEGDARELRGVRISASPGEGQLPGGPLGRFCMAMTRRRPWNEGRRMSPATRKAE
jgi:hypothetical protein